MNNKYDLSTFIEKEQKKTGVLDFGSFQIKIKEDAWTYVKIQALFAELKNKPDELAPAIVKTVMSEDDYKKVLSINLSVEGKEFWLIASHVIFLVLMSLTRKK